MTRIQAGGGGYQQRREGGHRPNQGGAPITVLFDPDKPEQELYDTLAETQAQALQINSSQLRKFFGEAKDLYRQFNALTAAATNDTEKDRVYRERIEARFRMLRSKVSYAQRRGGQAPLDDGFATFLKQAIQKVKNHQHFVRFILHFEAVVGFMYGLGKVRS